MAFEGYNKIATSDGFMGSNSVSVYHNKQDADFILEVDDEGYGPFTDAQLKLIVHAVTDVIHNLQL